MTKVSSEEMAKMRAQWKNYPEPQWPAIPPEGRKLLLGEFDWVDHSRFIITGHTEHNQRRGGWIKLKPI